MNVTELSVEQLRRAADLKAQIDMLQQQLTAILGGAASPAATPKVKIAKRRLSPAGRAAIIAATKARWERYRKQQGKPAAAAAPKRKMSAAARARLSALAKARWAKAKAAGRTRL